MVSSDSSADLVIPTGESPAAAVIFSVAQRRFIRDLSPVEGRLRLNGESIRQSRIRKGDIIEIAEHSFQVRLKDSSPGRRVHTDLPPLEPETELDAPPLVAVAVDPEQHPLPTTVGPNEAPIPQAKVESPAQQFEHRVSTAAEEVQPAADPRGAGDEPPQRRERTAAEANLAIFQSWGPLAVALVAQNQPELLDAPQPATNVASRGWKRFSVGALLAVVVAGAGVWLMAHLVP